MLTRQTTEVEVRDIFDTATVYTEFRPQNHMNSIERGEEYKQTSNPNFNILMPYV